MADGTRSGDALKNSGETALRLLSVVEAACRELRPRQAVASPITLDSTFDRDLGFDSLSRMEMLSRVEHEFGLTLSEQMFADVDTPRDLLRAVLGAAPTRLTVRPESTEAIITGEAGAVPHNAMTLVDVLNWHATAHPGRPHIQFYQDDGRGEVLTYGGLKAGSDQVAFGLQSFGLGPGEAVAIMLPSSRDYFFGFLGILKAGGVPVPVYPPARPSLIEEHMRRHVGILNNCQAGILITMPEASRLAHLIQAQVKSLRHVVTPEELAKRPAGLVQIPALTTNDTALLQYTSGSTGNPKGVILTHANLLSDIRAMGGHIKATAEDIFVSWLPLYHDMGLIGAWLGSLYHANLLVLMPSLAFLARPERWLTAITRYRGTLSAAPNFAYEQCLRRISDETLKNLDLSSWRLTCNGAEAISPQTIERFIRHFAPCGFRETAMFPAYGLAEATVGLSFPPLGRRPLIDYVQRDRLSNTGEAAPAEPGDEKALRFVSCGLPLPNHQIRIIDAAGRELPERHQGQLQFSGPSATSGYFRNPEKTAELFDGDWLNSGDLAYIARGEIYITGRIKDMIVRAGRNIYPFELEQAVGELEEVIKGNVAVFGCPDPETATERLIVLAESRNTDDINREELVAKINALTSDLIGTPPDVVVIAPPRTVLKTSSGKIRRAACREIYERGLIGKPRPTVWWQIMHMFLSGIVPGLRRALSEGGNTLYAVYAWTLFIAFTPIGWILIWLLPRLKWRWAAVQPLLRVLARLTGIPVEVRGLKNLPPPDKPCILAVNHASYLDGFVLVSTLPHPYGFVAKSELRDHWSTRILLNRLGAEFVERFEREKGIESARRVAGAVRAGKSLLFFPEGTFRRMPGLLPFLMGAFVTAVEADVPVVPVTIRGTRSMLREGTWFPRRGKIVVTIAEPLKPGKDASKDPWSAAVRLRDETRRQILANSGEPDLEHERQL